MKEIYKFIIVYILLIIFDAIYFMFVKNLFDVQIRAVQGSSIKLDILAFLLCYIFIAFALYYFSIRENKSILHAFLLGISIYAIYELTNKAILSKWKWSTVLLDTLWGGILFSIVAKVLTLSKSINSF
jgi:uncharacterized membrane protein